MFRWYAGRTMRTELTKKITAIENGSYSQPVNNNLARDVLTQLAFVEKTKMIAENLIVATENTKNAMRERQIAVAAGASGRDDVRWARPAIVESWATGFVGSAQGSISSGTFERIDAMVWSYIGGALTP